MFFWLNGGLQKGGFCPISSALIGRAGRRKKIMPQGLETGAIGVDANVDPLILLLVLCAFLIGAVGPFVACILGSLREERAMRGYAANRRASDATMSAANPVDETVIPVTSPLTLEAVVDTEPANDVLTEPMSATGR